MRVAAILSASLAFTAAAPCPAADDESGLRPSRWRDALAAEFRAEYERHVGAEKANSEDAPEPEAVAGTDIFRGPVEPETVVLEPLIVDGAGVTRRFEQLMDRTAARGSADFITRHLVRTEFQRDFGRFRFGVVSVLRIPILAGFSW